MDRPHLTVRREKEDLAPKVGSQMNGFEVERKGAAGKSPIDFVDVGGEEKKEINE